AGTRGGHGPTPRRAADVVKIVMCIREPEAVTFNRKTDSRMRLQLKNGAHVLQILQRGKIHVAIKFMVRGKQILKRLMLAIRRIIPGPAAAWPRRQQKCNPPAPPPYKPDAPAAEPPGLYGGGAGGLHFISPMLQPRSRRAAQPAILEISELIGGFQRVIPIAD